MQLQNGSRIAVVGGGPAGSFFSYFLLRLANLIELELQLFIYEFKHFSKIGPAGCNHCGGIVSESLVQLLATEGLNLPPEVVERGIESYVVHTDIGSVEVRTPLQERRIAAVYRGSGPLHSDGKAKSFDQYLLSAAEKRGAQIIHSKVEKITLADGKPVVHAKGLEPAEYDLLVGASGINTNTVEAFEHLGIGYHPPRSSKTYISEFQMGAEELKKRLGNSMHVFLVPFRGVQFAALIPKGDYATLCLIGNHIDTEVVRAFLSLSEIKRFIPENWDPSKPNCKCHPYLNTRAAVSPYSDRVVLIGDSAVTRLYKDGIGAAYGTAKATAVAAILDGISSQSFEDYYWPVCRQIALDNFLGQIIFLIVTLVKRFRFFRRAILRMVEQEQSNPHSKKDICMVLWDTFTGSAPYREILFRALMPSFLFRLTEHTARSIPVSFKRRISMNHSKELGTIYKDGQEVFRQGDPGDFMYVIQHGKVEVIIEEPEGETRLCFLGAGDIFGELSLFTGERRTATVRAFDQARIVTIDKRAFLRKVHQDPTLAFNLLNKMSKRIKSLSEEVLQLRIQLKADPPSFSRNKNV